MKNAEYHGKPLEPYTLNTMERHKSINRSAALPIKAGQEQLYGLGNRERQTLNCKSER